MKRTAPVGERDSFAMDLLFAAATVSALTGLNLPGTGVPVFVLSALAVFVVSFQSVRTSRYLRLLLIPPLLAFLVIHLAFAFRVTIGNGVVFVAQAAIVGSFVVAFVNRYCQVGMSRYLRLTGIGLTALLVYVLAYHLTRHVYVSFKLLDDPKAVFSLLPLALLVMRRSESRFSRSLFPFLLVLFAVIILISGERKAYILLALTGPLLINFRSPVTYIMPLLMAAAIATGLSLDKTGYVVRQIDTLNHLAQGDTEHTISDDARTWAIKRAQRMFLDSPIIGVGTNGFGLLDTTHVIPGTHDEWVRVAAENGVAGLFFYGATVVWGLAGLCRKRVGNRVRTLNEKLVAAALFATLVIYLSFEALDFIVLMAFLFTPLIQFLRLDPNDASPQPATAPLSRAGYAGLRQDMRNPARGQPRADLLDRPATDRELPI